MLRITGDFPALLELAMKTDSVESLQLMLQGLWHRDVDLSIYEVHMDEPCVETATLFYRMDEFPEKPELDKACMVGGVNIERCGTGWAWRSRT